MIKKEVFCEKCWKEIITLDIHYTYIPTNFTGDKDNTAVPNTFFCSQEHKKQWVQEHNERVKKNLPYLAEIDESMNYCEYFVRDKGNEGRYIRDGFEYQVNGLWDYKSYKEDFKYAFEKHFGHFDWFKLHNRYNLK